MRCVWCVCGVCMWLCVVCVVRGGFGLCMWCVCGVCICGVYMWCVWRMCVWRVCVVCIFLVCGACLCCVLGVCVCVYVCDIQQNDLPAAILSCVFSELVIGNLKKSCQ